MSIFFDNSITDIHKKIISREINPEIILNHLFECYDKYQPKYHPWISFDKEKAMSFYSKNIFTQKLQPLSFIPVAIKDIFNTVDYPTEMGSKLWAGFTPGNNARVVDSLIGAGACIAGKTVTAEFAVHELNETLNPWNISCTPGTSSSGSAVAVALGAVPIALGTQTAASIIRPASFCGIWGYKPTFGLIPRTGILKTTDSLDTVGILSTRLDNIPLAIEAIRVRGPNYPIVHDRYEKNIFRKSKIKIAFIKTHTWGNFDQEIKIAIEEFIKKLSNSQIYDVDEVILPLEFSESHRLHSTIYDKSLAYYFSHEYKNSEKISENMRSMIESGKKISAEYFMTSIEKQDFLIQKLDTFFDDYDFIVTGATATTAPIRGVLEKDDPSLMWTLTHAPSLVAPEFMSSNGMPFGIQFVARRYDDKRLIEFVTELVSVGLLRDYGLSATADWGKV